MRPRKSREGTHGLRSVISVATGNQAYERSTVHFQAIGKGLICPIFRRRHQYSGSSHKAPFKILLRTSVDLRQDLEGTGATVIAAGPVESRQGLMRMPAAPRMPSLSGQKVAHEKTINMATALSGTVDRDRGVMQLSVLCRSHCGQSRVGGSWRHAIVGPSQNSLKSLWSN